MSKYYEFHLGEYPAHIVLETWVDKLSNYRYRKVQHPNPLSNKDINIYDEKDILVGVLWWTGVMYYVKTGPYMGFNSRGNMRAPDFKDNPKQALRYIYLMRIQEEVKLKN